MSDLVYLDGRLLINSVLLISHLNHGPCLFTLYSPHSVPHGWDISFPETKAWEQMGINV